MSTKAEDRKRWAVEELQKLIELISNDKADVHYFELKQEPHLFDDGLMLGGAPSSTREITIRYVQQRRA